MTRCGKVVWTAILVSSVTNLLALPVDAVTVVNSGPLFTGDSIAITRPDNSVLTLPMAIWDYSTTLNGSTNGFSKAEAATFFNGKLYLSGDANADRFNRRVLEITPTPDNLPNATNVFELPQPPNLGFEGMTVNFTNSGFGNNAGGLRLVGFEATGSAPWRWVNFGSNGAISDVVFTNDTDRNYRLSDVAFVGSRDRFAILLDTLDADLQWVDKNTLGTLAPAVSTIAQLPAAAKGMTVIPGDVASFLAGTPLPDPEYLLLTAQGTAAQNRLGIYRVNDDFTPVAAMTLGAMIDDAGDLESVAFDPAFKRLYLVEDQGVVDVGGMNVNKARIYTFSVPEPTSSVWMTFLCLGCLGLRHRRLS